MELEIIPYKQKFKQKHRKIGDRNNNKSTATPLPKVKQRGC